MDLTWRPVRESTECPKENSGITTGLLKTKLIATWAQGTTILIWISAKKIKNQTDKWLQFVFHWIISINLPNLQFLIRYSRRYCCACKMLFLNEAVKFIWRFLLPVPTSSECPPGLQLINRLILRLRSRIRGSCYIDYLIF